MRIGYFGGSFDPVHVGHVALAREVAGEMELDALRFLVARRPPHKPDRALTAGAHRAAMLELALAGEERLQVDRREFGREGPSYTVLSMEEVRAEEPDAELFFLIGADNLPDLPGWFRFADLARMVTFLVAERPGEPAPDDALLGRIGARRVRVTARDVSSTEIRRRAAAGSGLEELVGAPVAAYIAREGLYRDAADRFRSGPRD